MRESQRYSFAQNSNKMQKEGDGGCECYILRLKCVMVWRSHSILGTGAGRIQPAPTFWNNFRFIFIESENPILGRITFLHFANFGKRMGEGGRERGRSKSFFEASVDANFIKNAGRNGGSNRR